MRGLLLYALFLMSGAAGLVYELVWVRELIFVFGGTTYAITTVLVAFMAGLGLGSYLAGRWSQRLARPGRVYGALEISVGLYALLVPILLGVAESVYGGMYDQLEHQPWLLNLARFALSGLILVVPTTFMGATLPVLVRYVTLHGRGLGRAAGLLYGINTLGAVLGVMLAGFWLLPTFGLTHTTWLAAAGNLLIGLTGVFLLGPPQRGTARSVDTGTARADEVVAAAHITPGLRRWLLLGFAVSGATAMMYQIAWTRALILSLGSSTYAFTCILAAFILGLALGSLAIARWVDRWRSPLLAFGIAELLIGLTAVVIVPLHGQIPLVVQRLVAAHASDYTNLLRLQFLLVIAVTIVPTFLMGAIFPLVIRALDTQGSDPGAATGRAYAVNTVGTIAGSFVAGFILIRSDVLGVQDTIILGGVLNGLVGAALLVRMQPARGAALVRRALVPVAVLVLIPLVGLGAGKWDPRVLTAAPFLNQTIELAQRQIVFFAEDVDLTVAVEHPPDHPELLGLTVNGKPDASTGPDDLPTQLLLGHFPALLAEQNRTACVIGLGSGMTLGALACHPTYERLDCVEISAGVIQAAAYFNPYTNHVLTADPRVRMLRADGRNHLLLTAATYDVIVSEPSNPWMSGVSNLFTREFFTLARARLNERGLLTVWLHGYSMSLHDFQMVVRTLLEVFDHVALWEARGDDYMLIASRQPLQLSWPELVRRFDEPAVRADLYRIGIYRPAQILGRYIASERALRDWVAASPVHTDDNARLEFSAPRYVLLEDGTNIARALEALQRPDAADLFSPAAKPPAAVTEGTRGVITARWAPRRADAAADRRDFLGALRLLLEGCRGDPASVPARRAAERAFEAIRTHNPQVATSPEFAPLARHFERIQPPLTAAVQGTPLAELAELRRGRARKYARQGDWCWAADEWLEVARLVPGDTHAEQEGAAALAHCGRTPATANPGSRPASAPGEVR